MFILKNKYEGLLKVVVHVIVFIGIISMAMKVQMEQSNFDNSINNVQFSRKLAYDSNHELKEYVDKNYVQQIIWKAYPLLVYPESISSRVLFKREVNQKSIDEVWQDVMSLVEDYAQKETNLGLRMDH
ncbi:hypothetical protein IGK08_002825 [Enterococcus sp. DIV1286c]|jgi:hypothetical protein|uniref:hypothetical protein n=1 Tax=Enterococcus TaxID=1350 RepID=UPI000825CE89|nr:hypothetical protein [Enterococcus mundtii]AZP91628.1 hypothetical protein CYK55_00095 [Enterococcus mundtii]MDF2534449.1 hypothetical protein [Bacillales bacterium]QCJ57883.1 hypothetical protein DDJ96_14920 [Enterococcus mundtii]